MMIEDDYGSMMKGYNRIESSFFCATWRLRSEYKLNPKCELYREAVERLDYLESIGVDNLVVHVEFGGIKDAPKITIARFDCG